MKRLSFIFLFFSVFLIPLFAFTAFAQEQIEEQSQGHMSDLPEVSFGLVPTKADVERYLNDITSMRARFTQQGPDGRLSSGQLHIERPGRARFEYDNDIPILIVSDGNQLNMIDYEVGQVTKWPVNETPLHLLLAETIVLGDTVTVSVPETNNPNQMLAITAHDPQKPEQGSFTLIFTFTGSESDPSKGLMLRAWQVVDAQGQLTTVSVSRMEKNPALEARLWTFEDPRGERFERRRRR